MPRAEKRAGRKNARNIGDAVERDDRDEWLQQGYVAFRVPVKKRRNNAHFQQWKEFATWDVVVILEAIIIQDKRRYKGMSKRDKETHKKSCKLFPKSKLIPMMAWRDKGIKREQLE